jgi:CRISPR-associated protein Cas1
MAQNMGARHYEIPLVVCDNRHEPLAILLSLTGHHLHAGRIRAQAESAVPVRKRIWRDLVKKKIAEQARSLKRVDPPGSEGLLKLVSSVRSGDPDNIEARAARYYWPRLFGTDFRRDRSYPGLNAHLNYGYTILRSALARAVIAAGLAPSIGVGHINARNNFCLVDDLIEPFRPLVDRLVWDNRGDWSQEVTLPARTELAGIMGRSVQTENGETDLFRAMTLVVSSLVNVFEGKAAKLYLPKEISFVTMPHLPGF